MLIIQPDSSDEIPPISICNGELALQVTFETLEEDEFEDNVMLSFDEDCPEDAALFRASSTMVGMTSEQARELARRLIAAADQNDQWLAQRKSL